ncbi:MAG: hypothetical protein IJK62_04695 [Bacteroidales bacterium]|nr:hypothetical protein [Bacteroidales bacterium]
MKVRLLALLFAFSLFCVLQTSCTTSSNLADNSKVKVLSDKIWTYSQSHPDGFTIDIRTMTEPTKGIAVSYYATQGSHSRKNLNRVVRHALHHDGYVGGWLDTADSLYYFDSTRLFPKDSLEDAIKFVLKNRQKAIFSIEEKKRNQNSAIIFLFLSFKIKLN